jgi:hypothetical protein
LLNNLSEHVRECLRHAEDCARQAAAETDARMKGDFLDLEQRWLSLARSYQFTERVDDFLRRDQSGNRRFPEATT